MTASQAQDGLIERVVADCRPEEAIELTRKLVAIESVSGSEQAVAEFVASWLSSNGIAPRLAEIEPGRPNVFAHIGPPSTPAVLFTGHTDTVPAGNGWTRDPFGAALADGRIYGRGSSDMKSGIAAMLVALASARRNIPEPSHAISFAGVIDEEVSGKGTRAAIAEGIAARFAVLAEPTDLQVVCAAKGNAYFRIEVAGRASHAGSPELGVNAITTAAEIAGLVAEHDRQIKARSHPLLGSPHATVTRMTGGEGDSIVPSLCSLLIDRRLLPGERAAHGLAELRDFILGHVAPDRHGAIAFHLDMELPPMEVDANNPLVGELLEASRLSGGTNRQVGGWTAASDGGLLVGTAAIPTVLFGPGSIVNQAHRADESVPVDEIAVATRTYARIAARAMLGLIA